MAGRRTRVYPSPVTHGPETERPHVGPLVCADDGVGYPIIHTDVIDDKKMDESEGARTGYRTIDGVSARHLGRYGYDPLRDQKERSGGEKA